MHAHVAGGYASGVVALIGEGEAAEVLAVGGMALGGLAPMRRAMATSRVLWLERWFRRLVAGRSDHGPNVWRAVFGG
jgi:hypothetical protein